MKTMLLFVAMMFAVALSSSSATTVTGVAKFEPKERGVMQFNRPVRLLGAELKGEYLFVHDNEAMARGEACTFVYQGTAEFPKKLVASFHCTPKVRNKVTAFTVRTRQRAPGVEDVEEIQFAGSAEGHVVPTHHHVVISAPN